MATPFLVPQLASKGFLQRSQRFLPPEGLFTSGHVRPGAKVGLELASINCIDGFKKLEAMAVNQALNMVEHLGMGQNPGT